MDSAARAAGVPYYRSPSSLSHTSSDKKQPHLSLTRMTTLHGGMKNSSREKDGGMIAEASAGASASLENLWFHRKANGLLHCEKEAFDIVYDAILSLVSQFGGYIITRVEGRSVPSGLNIVGFKSPSAAIRFGLSAQAKLMEYPWRAEILNSSRMKEVKCKRAFPYSADLGLQWVGTSRTLASSTEATGAQPAWITERALAFCRLSSSPRWRTGASSSCPKSFSIATGSRA